MVERRLKCLSKTCSSLGKCGVIWKVFHCTAHDKWETHVNLHAHQRGVLPCTAEHKPIVTQLMKDFIAAQDDIGNPPRVILSHLKKQSTIRPSKAGWPQLAQIQNALKCHMRSKGTKNSIKAVHDIARARGFNPNLNQDSFLFGPKLDSDGHTYIGSGEDDFIVGVTSCALIDACLQFSQSGNAIQFHADATFKLSDLGYPVITCGFTDQARSYQVGAVFVVSQRTEHVYTECFKSFVEIVNQVRGMLIHANTAMSDAEDAQYLALGNVPEFATATRPMCFFHVMYNVRKRTRHLHVHDRVFVMNSILEMHLSRSELAFQVCRDREISKWRKKAHLHEFVDYFEQQWLTGRYWRWQIFHNPEGYALTNNPCENLNGGIKHFLQRRRLHMCRLLEKLGDFIDPTTLMLTQSPVPALHPNDMLVHFLLSSFITPRC